MPFVAGGRGGFGGGGSTLVDPGVYMVRLTVGDKTYRSSVQVLEDIWQRVQSACRSDNGEDRRRKARSFFGVTLRCGQPGPLAFHEGEPILKRTGGADADELKLTQSEGSEWAAE